MPTSRSANPEYLRLFFPAFLVKGRDGIASRKELEQILQKREKTTKTEASRIVTQFLRDNLLVAESGGLRLPKEEEIEYSTHDFYCFECNLPGDLEHCSECCRSFHLGCSRDNPKKPTYQLPLLDVNRVHLPLYILQNLYSTSDYPSISNHRSNPSLQSVNSEDSYSNIQTIVTESGASSLRQDRNSVSNSTTTISGLKRRRKTIAFDSNGPSTSDQAAIKRMWIEMDADPSSASRINLNTIITRRLSSIGSKTRSPAKHIPRRRSSLLSANQAVQKEEDIFDEKDYDIKEHVDVVCMGQTRPPMRVRPSTTLSNISYKSEMLAQQELENENNGTLCTCCRLLKSASTYNPPNIQADELCYLLKCCLKTHRTWIKQDAMTVLENIKLSSNQKRSIVNLLWKKVSTFKKIESDVNKNSYSLLVKFYIDLLDLQHNIGVFFGAYSEEFEETKYLVLYVDHDLSEIRRCCDCFRYSQEKGDLWFAKPCVQRHELVFAKTIGYSYWPAKVVRCLPDGRFDVRYFGGKHERAAVEASSVIAIDSDIESLRPKTSAAFKEAMAEVRHHENLSSKYGPSVFSFYADKNHVRQIIDEEKVKYELPKKKAQKRTANGTIINDTIATSPIVNVNHSVRRSLDFYRTSQHLESMSPISSTTIQNLQVNSEMEMNTTQSPSVSTSSNMLLSSTINDLNSPRRSIRLKTPKSTQKSTENNKSCDNTVCIATMEKLKLQSDAHRKKAANYKKSKERTEKENLELKSEIIILKEEAKTKVLEEAIVKKKHWCAVCLVEATFYCCFAASYCSRTCQSRHWPEHKAVCKMQQPTASTIAQ